VFTLRWDGETWEGNSLQYNTGGSNRRLKLKGMTAAGERLSEAGGQGRLEHKVQVWFAAADGTFDLALLERDEPTVVRLKALSAWSERTQAGTGGRAYGLFDLDLLRRQVDRSGQPADDRAEWMTWRYAILPQLVETMSQLGGEELIDAQHRSAWLSEHGTPDVAERLATFDQFTGELGLLLQIQGRSLGRGLTIVETGLTVGGTADPEGTADDDG